MLSVVLVPATQDHADQLRRRDPAFNPQRTITTKPSRKLAAIFKIANKFAPSAANASLQMCLLPATDAASGLLVRADADASTLADFAARPANATARATAADGTDTLIVRYAIDEEIQRFRSTPDLTRARVDELLSERAELGVYRPPDAGSPLAPSGCAAGTSARPQPLAIGDPFVRTVAPAPSAAKPATGDSQSGSAQVPSSWKDSLLRERKFLRGLATQPAAPTSPARAAVSYLESSASGRCDAVPAAAPAFAPAEAQHATNGVASLPAPALSRGMQLLEPSIDAFGASPHAHVPRVTVRGRAPLVEDSLFEPSTDGFGTGIFGRGSCARREQDSVAESYAGRPTPEETTPAPEERPPASEVVTPAPTFSFSRLTARLRARDSDQASSPSCSSDGGYAAAAADADLRRGGAIEAQPNGHGQETEPFEPGAPSAGRGTEHGALATEEALAVESSGAAPLDEAAPPPAGEALAIDLGMGPDDEPPPPSPPLAVRPTGDDPGTSCPNTDWLHAHTPADPKSPNPRSTATPQIRAAAAAAQPDVTASAEPTPRRSPRIVNLPPRRAADAAPRSPPASAAADASHEGESSPMSEGALGGTGPPVRNALAMAATADGEGGEASPSSTCPPSRAAVLASAAAFGEDGETSQPGGFLPPVRAASHDSAAARSEDEEAPPPTSVARVARRSLVRDSVRRHGSLQPPPPPPPPPPPLLPQPLPRAPLAPWAAEHEDGAMQPFASDSAEEAQSSVRTRDAEAIDSTSEAEEEGYSPSEPPDEGAPILRGEHADQQPPPNATTSPPPAPVWACPRCTLDNAADAAVCAACEAPRARSRGAPARFRIPSKAATQAPGSQPGPTAEAHAKVRKSKVARKKTPPKSVAPSGSDFSSPAPRVLPATGRAQTESDSDDEELSIVHFLEPGREEPKQAARASLGTNAGGGKRKRRRLESDEPKGVKGDLGGGLARIDAKLSSERDDWLQKLGPQAFLTVRGHRPLSENGKRILVDLRRVEDEFWFKGGVL